MACICGRYGDPGWDRNHPGTPISQFILALFSTQSRASRPISSQVWHKGIRPERNEINGFCAACAVQHDVTMTAATTNAAARCAREIAQAPNTKSGDVRKRSMSHRSVAPNGRRYSRLKLRLAVGYCDPLNRSALLAFADDKNFVLGARGESGSSIKRARHAISANNTVL